jgi:hypothetical protein
MIDGMQAAAPGSVHGAFEHTVGYGLIEGWDVVRRIALAIGVGQLASGVVRGFVFVRESRR